MSIINTDAAVAAAPAGNANDGYEHYISKYRKDSCVRQSRNN